MTTHLVQFSTGIGSAEVAFRVYDLRAPDDRVVLLTADTLVEDEDNWRFAREVVARLPEAEWTVLTDGRTPMQVGRDRKCVPSNRMAVCSQILKRDLIRAHLDEHYDPADSVVYLGYDWTEDHRMDKAVEPWRPWTVRCPLMDPPHVMKADLLEQMRARGIEPPRLYATGAPHANCGGACVRGGQVEWRRLLLHNRDRYVEWEKEEEVSRVELGKDVAILRHRSGPLEGTALTLRSYRETLERDAGLFDTEDFGACGCDPWAE
jgi:hypothetical protein